MRIPVILFFECIQEGLWRRSIGRPFFFKFGLEKEAKGRLYFLDPTSFLNTFNLFFFAFFSQELSRWEANIVDCTISNVGQSGIVMGPGQWHLTGCTVPPG